MTNFKVLKRFSLALITLCFLISVLPSDTLAVHKDGKSGLYCKFTSGKVMETNFKTAFDDENLTLQPGDDITFTISLENEYAGTATWYMTNEVINSFEQGRGAHTGGEEGATTGGVYEYVLTYIKPDGTPVTLYDSKILGGTEELSEELRNRLGGLRGATDELKDYFYLDDLTQGQKATITLNIALDGETQGNAYQDTLADLQMNFAVELPRTTPTPTVSPTPTTPGSSTNRSSTTTGRSTTSSTSVVKTGDETNLRGYFIAVGVAGAVLLVLGIVAVRYRKKTKEDEK